MSMREIEDKHEATWRRSGGVELLRADLDAPRSSGTIIETGTDSYRLATNRARHQRLKQWRGIATRYEKNATSTWPDSTSRTSSRGQTDDPNETP
ncbi:hypothetical protein [Streptomyces niveus]|uniref:hypothetical protein n=1 Tax=Streptomyces niveus TaxID=193462 RepID=UPI0037AB33AF